MAILQSSAITGSLTVSGSSNNLVQLQGSGSTVFIVNGASGQLFGVSDDLTDSLFSVNTISGLPVIEAFADNTVKLGTYGNEELIVSGSQVYITSASLSGPATFSGVISGNGSGLTSLNASNLSSGTVSDARLPGTISSDITGNSATATKLATPRNIALTGAVTGNANFDGNSNISITTTATSDPTLTLDGHASGTATFTNLGNATLTVTVANDSHTHDGRYYTETESDNRFVNVAGDTMTGDLNFDSNNSVGMSFVKSGGDLNLIIDSNNNSNTSALVVEKDTQTKGNGTELFRVEESGNVGIGTTSPDTLLEISGNAGADPGPITNPTTFRITDAGNAATGAGDTTNPWGRIQFYSEDTSSGGPSVQAQIASIYGSIYSNSSHLTFYTQALPSTGIVERMRITSAGNVGIGTTSPGNKLDVNGGIDANTLNTGQGDNELYAMNQNVRTTDNVTFNDITANGLININDYEGLDMTDTYSFWRRNYVVGSNPPAQLLDKDGNALSSGGVYRFHAHISGTGTDQWATAVYWNQNGTWKLNVTQQSGTSSNHPEFIIDSNVPKIEIDHPNNYTINVFHERLNLSEGSGTDNNAGFGADGFLSNVSGTLRFNAFGGTSNFSSGTQRVFHDGYHPNADILTTPRTIGGVSFDGSANINLPGVNTAGNQNTSGNAATATKLATPRNIALTGAVTGDANFDGTGNISISTTATSDPTLTLAGHASGTATFTNLGNATLTVAVANDSHTHDGRYYTETESDARFLGISAKAADSDLLDGINSSQFLRSDTSDSTSGNLTVGGDLFVNDYARIDALRVGTTSTDPGDGNLYVEGTITGNGSGLTSLNASNLSSGTVSDARLPGTISSDITGNAATATKWAAARTITIGNTGKAVDGSGDVSWSLSEIGAASRTLTLTAGDGLTGGGNLTANRTFAVDNTVVRTSGNQTIAGVKTFSSTIAGSINGNAATATKWAASKTITLGGDLTGNVSIDGSANVTLSAQVANDSHTHDGRYYTESESDSRFVNVTGDTMTGTLTIDTGAGSEDALVIRGDSPTISFIDQGTSDDFYIHVNSNNFYVLRDVAGADIVGTGWDSPHPLQLEGDTNVGYLFGNRMFADNYHPNADKWTTARTITLGGDLSGNVSIDGSANVTLNAAVSGRLEMTGVLDMNNQDIYGVDQIFHHGDTNTYMQFHASDQWRVVTGGTERLEVNNSAVTVAGDLTITNGNVNVSSGNGIDFSATANASGISGYTPTDISEVLDDYEEGFWEPIFVSNGILNANNDIVTGTYVKIGRAVHINGYLRSDNMTKNSNTSAAVYIENLPFSPDDGKFFSVEVGFAGSWGSDHPDGGYIQGTQARISLVFRNTADGASVTVNAADLSTGTDANKIIFSATYFTD